MSKQAVTPEAKVETYSKMKLLTTAVVVLVAGFLFSWFSKSVYYSYFLPKKIVEINGKQMTLPQGYDYLRKLSVKYRSRPEVRKRIELAVKGIEQTYPVPSLVNLMDGKKYPDGRGLAWSFFVLEISLFVCLFGFMIWFEKAKLKPFFIRLPIVEPAIEFGKTGNFLNLKYLKIPESVVSKTFNGKENYVKLMQVWDTTITADVRVFKKEDRKKIKPNDVVIDFIEVNKDIKKITDELVRYGKRTGMLDKQEVSRFRFAVALTLFHFITGMFGNMPTGFASVYIKDYAVKRMLGVYMFGKIPNTEFLGSEKQKEILPAEWLRIFHGYRREKRDFLRDVKAKYLQIPDIIPLREV